MGVAVGATVDVAVGVGVAIGRIVGVTVGVNTTASSGAEVGSGSPHAAISRAIIAKKKIQKNVGLRMAAIITRRCESMGLSRQR